MKPLSLAQLPTPIRKLERLSLQTGKNIYLKRDDLTGNEVSGNKVRKLEYCLADALQKGCDTIITVGGIQSNHCRATAAVCAQSGLDCHLVLRGEMKEFEGNLFLDTMLGAEIHLLRPGACRETYAQELLTTLTNKGKRPYLIPLGASDATGSLGYVQAFDEILSQEKALGLRFDAVILAVGSGGTYAGLWYRNLCTQSSKRIYGIAVDESSAHFHQEVSKIVGDMDPNVADFSSIEINDAYIGLGYAKSSPRELAALAALARMEGVVLDPCYTGKAYLGMMGEIPLNTFRNEQNLLFLHTGGLQGWTKEQREHILTLTKEANKFHEL